MKDWPPTASPEDVQDWMDFAADGFVISPARQAKMDAWQRQSIEILRSASRADPRLEETFRRYVEDIVFDPANHRPTAKGGAFC